MSNIPIGFIVEGFNDEHKIKEILPDALCVVTKGTRMNKRVRMDIEEALNNCDKLYILVDPDSSGDKITDMVYRYYPDIQRIYLDKDKCMCLRHNKWKIGVEHCEREYLKEVLANYIEQRKRVT